MADRNVDNRGEVADGALADIETFNALAFKFAQIVKIGVGTIEFLDFLSPESLEAGYECVAEVQFVDGEIIQSTYIGDGHLR